MYGRLSYSTSLPLSTQLLQLRFQLQSSSSEKIRSNALKVWLASRWDWPQSQEEQEKDLLWPNRVCMCV